MIACGCVDHTTRQIMAERADSLADLPNQAPNSSALDPNFSVMANNLTLPGSGALDVSAVNANHKKQNKSK